MASAALFPSVLGVAFDALDPCLKRVHSGRSQRLQGTATVERGASLLARVLAAIAALPPAGSKALIQVRIDATDDEELWTRVFSPNHRMASRLHEHGGFLVERLGPATLKFRVSVQNGAMAWTLERISVCKIPLPVRWFCVSAMIDSRDGRYHFAVNSELRGVGRIVRYEGCLDAAA